MQRERYYIANIMNNIPLNPEASPVVRVSAKLYYSIIYGDVVKSFLGLTGHKYERIVTVTDQAGEGVWQNLDQAVVRQINMAVKEE